MTTVYIDKRAGLLLTDSRITSTKPRTFLGVFPLTPKQTFFKTFQKSMYIHDRLFSAAGSVSEINKVLNYLINGTAVIPNYKDGCHCVLIGKCYCIHFFTLKGKFCKIVEFIDNTYTYAMGSGGEYMVNAKCSDEEGEDLVKCIFEEFNKVKDNDIYSNDDIKVYRI